MHAPMGLHMATPIAAGRRAFQYLFVQRQHCYRSVDRVLLSMWLSLPLQIDRYWIDWWARVDGGNVSGVECEISQFGSGNGCANG